MSEIPPAPPGVLIHVQHLLGSGHLQRSLLLARALTDAGCRVLLFSGGPPVPTLDLQGLDLRQLPVLRSPDAEFSRLVDADGNPPAAAVWQVRAERLRAGLQTLRPRAVLIEGWPFARRKFSDEILGLLRAARELPQAPRIVTSVRDVLQRHGRAERYRETAARVREWIDLVLVHADPALLRLEDSFPLVDEIAGRIRYTGYVCRPPDAAAARVSEAERGRGEILVSAGGGAVGLHLLETAMQAARLIGSAGAGWRLLVSHAVAETELQRLRAHAPIGVRIERNRPDFVELLRRCRVSVSQAGYNTLVELLQTRTPAVLVPFAGGRETEQLQRAGALAAGGHCVCLPESELTAASLADAVQRAAELGPPRPDLNLDGAARTAAILLQAMADSA